MANNRRKFLNHSAIGIFGLLPFLHKKSPHSSIINPTITKGVNTPDNNIYSLYPSTDPAVISEVVGAAHTNLDKVKALVTQRPELAKATYNWGFGDVESALGAASHMGRKDIAEFLIEYGARPNIFTFAMLGRLNTIKAMVEDLPGIHKINGPHGFTLMHHAQIRLRRDMVQGVEKEQQEALVAYLESLGDADIRDTSLEISAEEKKIYLGKYVFGEKGNEYFQLTENTRGMLFMSRGEHTGRVLNRTGDHTFAPGGAPSVAIKFELQNGNVTSLTIHDPDPIIKAIKA